MTDIEQNQDKVKLSMSHEDQVLFVTPNLAMQADFDVSKVTIGRAGNDIVLQFEDGGNITLKNIKPLIDSNQSPTISFEDGSVLSTKQFISFVESSKSEIEPAAGNPEFDSGGVSEYRDDPGTILDGIDKLDGLDFAPVAPDNQFIVDSPYEPLDSQVAIDISITLDADITIDDNINATEAGQLIPITGSVGSDVKDGDIVTLTINDKTFTGQVSGGRFSIDVPGIDLVNDPDNTIEASVTTTDPNGNEVTATDTEKYTVGDVPVARDDVIITTEDTTTSGNLAGNDAPGDGPSEWELASGPSHGSVTVNTDGTFTYTPDPNYNGPDSFTYTIEDANGDVSTATANITVEPVDDLPVAVGDTITATEDTPISGDLSANDTPSGDGGNVWALASPPGNGTVTVNPDGTYTYTPNPDYNGPDSFTYTITDADGSVDTATTIIMVVPVDDTPDAVDDTLAAVEDTPLIGTLAGNDVPSGDGGNVWALDSPPTNGTVTVSPDGSFTYVPNANYNGPDSFTYTITDADGSMDTATATITVGAVNDVPDAVDDTLAAVEDTPLTGTLAGNDIPSGDGGNVWALASAPANGSVVVGADGTFTYVPNADYSGPDSFTYTITDADGSVDTATATIAVAPANDVPDALDDTFTAIEDTPLTGNLAGNDIPSADGGNIWALASPPTNGTVTVNPDGSFTYLPDPDYNGPDSFTYTITDADGSVDTAMATITVGEVGDVPLAVDDTLTATEDTPLTGTLAGNDIPSGDGGNVWALATPPSNGTVTVNPDGTFTYTPNADYNGQDSFTYTITDGDGDVSTATATITVDPADDAPDAVDDTLAAVEDTPLTGTLAGNDVPSGDGGNVWALDSPPTNGTVTVNPNGTFTYVPNADYNGPDSFTYTITDADGSVDTATATIAVAPVNDVPDAVDDTLAAVEDTPLTGTLAGNDVPSGDGGNVWALDSPPTNGTVTVNPDGTYTYTPNPNYNGPDSFTYTITDADGSADTATATIDVAQVNDVPDAVDDTLAAVEDTPLTGTLAGNDVPSGDGGNVWALASPPTNGTVTVSPDGSFTYVPNANYNGPDSFTYTITDADGSVDTATATIAVAPVNDEPVAVGDAITATEDTPISGDLSTNDTPSGDGGNVWALASPPTNGTVTVNPDGTYTYTPNSNYNGPDNFTYTITDADGSVDTATAIIMVAPVDDTPDAVDDTLAAVEDTPLTGTLAGNDIPSGDGGNVWALASPPTNGTVTVSPDGSFSYVPNPDYNGPDSFTYTITDTDGSVDTATATIAVAPANDAPVAEDDTIITAEDTPVSSTVNLQSNDTDPDGDILSIAAVSVGTFTTAQGGTIVVAADGSYTYTPAPDFSGEDTFDYTVTDGSLTDVGTLTITVTPGNEAPVANVDSYATVEGSALTSPQSVLANDTDAENDPLAAIRFATDATGSNAQDVNGTNAVTTALGGTVVLNADGTFQYTAPILDHSAEDIRTDSFYYQASDGQDASGWTRVDIAVSDTVPTATNIEQTLGDPDTSLTYNLVIVLDCSRSMSFDADGTDPDDPFDTTPFDPNTVRMDIAKSAIAQLMARYDQIGNVNVQFVEFSTYVEESQWYVGDVQAATDHVDGIQHRTGTAGATQYDNALNAVTDSFSQPSADRSFVYFISDGDPNAGHEVDPALQAQWESFLVDNNIDISYGVGIGEVSLDSLHPVAYPNPGGSEDHAVLLTDATQLPNTLLATVVDSQASGDLTVDSGSGSTGIVFGADGGHIASVTIGTTTLLYDANNPEQTMTTSQGGTLRLNFNTGEYTYELTAGRVLNQDEVFSIEGVDGDGDTATMTLTIQPSSQTLDAVDDTVLTNATSWFFGSDPIEIPDAALLHNDSGSNLTIDGVYDDINGTAVHGNGEVTYDMDWYRNSGNFSYTAGDGQSSDSANVNITRSTSFDTIDGTDQGEVIVGVDNNDTLNGNGGNDALVGNEGNDLLVGGDGNDLLIGGDGSDTFAFSAYGNEGSDTITDFNVAEDVIRLSDVVNADGDGGIDLDDLLQPGGQDVAVNVNSADVELSISNGSGTTTVVTLTGINAGGAFDGDTTLTDLINHGLNVDLM